VPVNTKAARVAACPYCESTLIVNEAAIRALGKMALLAETPSCLAVGWRASLKGREIEVLGRLQYRYSAGLWDEWWVRFLDDGAYAWISQDEGEYMLEHALPHDAHVPNYPAVRPGDRVYLGDRELFVEEKNHAVMVGLQGEIPLEANPDKRMFYLDLTDNKVKATVEYFEDGTHMAFQGEYLGPEDLQSEVTAAEVGAEGRLYKPAALKSPGEDGEIIRSADSIKLQSFNCPYCGGTVEVKDPKKSVMIVCQHCGSGLDITVPGKAQIISKAEKRRLPFPIDIGEQGTLHGVKYTAIGRVRYEERDEGEIYRWDSLQLFNPDRGYAFLELEDGHWMFFTALRSPVNADPRYALPKQKIRHRGQTFKVFETGAAEITYVEGELSWVARKGDKVQYMDAIRPPQMLSAEWTENELEWSLGSYVPPGEVARVFGKTKSELPVRTGVSPAQPFKRTRTQRISAWAGLAAGVAMLVLAGLAWTYGRIGGTPILYEQAIQPAAYLSEQGWISEPFEIPEGSHICRLGISSNGLRNQWVSVSMAFLDEQENVVMDADATVEYYYGSSGGESWSEGSRTDYALFRLEGPQTYRLNIFGQGGQWSRGSGSQPSTNVPAFELWLKRGVFPARYFLIAAILALLYPVYEFGRQILFESKRWPSDDD